jgi:hypothetical protein
MTTVLTETGEFTATARDGLWLSAADAERVTGWSWKPEGMCRADLCVPLPAGATRAGAVDGAVDVAAFWRKLDGPVLHDDRSETWVLGTPASARNDALAGLRAPDFTLPDLAGTPHRLSALRGKKVFLATWASW